MKKDPAEEMKYADALAVTSGLSYDLHMEPVPLTRLLLTLRWLAYNATEQERETLHIETEAHVAQYTDGVDEAVREQMRRYL